jgi:hypothetical protein
MNYLIYCIYIFEFALLDGVVNTIQSNIYEVVLGYFQLAGAFLRANIWWSCSLSVSLAQTYVCIIIIIINMKLFKCEIVTPMAYSIIKSTTLVYNH